MLLFSCRPKHVILTLSTCTLGRHLAQSRWDTPARSSGVNKGSFYDLRLLSREVKITNITTASLHMPQFKVNSLYAFLLPALPQTTTGLEEGGGVSIDYRQSGGTEGKRQSHHSAPGSGPRPVLSNFNILIPLALLCMFFRVVLGNCVFFGVCMCQESGNQPQIQASPGLGCVAGPCLSNLQAR